MEPKEPSEREEPRMTRDEFLCWQSDLEMSEHDNDDDAVVFWATAHTPAPNLTVDRKTEALRRALRCCARILPRPKRE
jgi:hypothetical protein